MQANRYVPGSVAHDAYIGDESAQDDHGSEMNGDLGNGMNDDSGAVTAEPGDTAELTHTFTAGNDELVGCHEPGHYDSGMRLTVNIS